MSEKVWRGCIETDDGEWPKDDERPYLYRNTVAGVAQKLPSYTEQIAILPAADYDALQARVAEIERLRNHKPETPDDERSWIPYLLDAKARIATLEAELAAKTAENANAMEIIESYQDSLIRRKAERDTALAELATAREECERLREEIELRNALQADGLFP